MRGPGDVAEATIPTRVARSQGCPFGMRLLLLALVGLVAVTIAAAERSGRTLRYVERQNVLNAELPRLMAVLQDLSSAETGQRGYLLTGRSAYLEPYLEAVQGLDAQLAALVHSHGDDPMRQARLMRAQTLAQLKLADMRETIRLQERGRPGGALELMKSDHGKRLMDELRELIQQLIAQSSGERDLLATEIAEAASSTRLMQVVGTSLLVVFVSLSMWQLSAALRGNARLVDRLAQEATHDALTGLPNRRQLLQWLEQGIAVSARGGPTVAVVFIDLDGFKRVNDVCGHEAGDRLLKAVGDAFKRTLRQSDLLCRIGGDEFAVVAIDPGGESDLHRLGQRLVEAAGHLGPVPGLAQHVVGASVGISVFPLHGHTAAHLIDSADQAMYAAKQAGKGCVRFAQRAASPESPSPRCHASSRSRATLCVAKGEEGR